MNVTHRGGVPGLLSIFAMKTWNISLELANFTTHHGVYKQKPPEGHESLWWRFFPIVLALFVPLVAGCTSNRAFRTGEMVCQGSQCDKEPVIIEHHESTAHQPLFDLAFVEFTERGNVFDRKKMDQVLDHVHDLATAKDTGDESPCTDGKGERVKTQGVVVVVFVHGWRHNADAEDENVKSFRRLLEKAADRDVRCEILGKRKLVGIYVGWRGLSLDPDPLMLTLLSFWDRKAVAHEVGKGGVSELLLRLQREVFGEEDHEEDSQAESEAKNLFLVTGHSFGGAIVLSALNEVLLERIVTAQPTQRHCDPQAPPGCACLQTRPFAHGVVLLNPAIEANDVFQMKELVAQKCFAATQNKLLHVISSDADIPTHWAFPIGQWLAMRWWREAQLPRRFGSTEITFEESELDTATIGNFAPFRTGKFTQQGTKWEYHSCEHGSDDCLSEFSDDPAEQLRHIPVSDHEPLAFITTDKHFIENHNAIFNDNVVAYLAAIVDQTRAKQDPNDKDLPDECKMKDGVFSFGECFDHFLSAFHNGGNVSSQMPIHATAFLD